MLNLDEVEGVLRRSESVMKMRTRTTKRTKRNVQRRRPQRRRNLRRSLVAVTSSFPSFLFPLVLWSRCPVVEFLACLLLLSALVALINPIECIPDFQNLPVFGLPFGSTTLLSFGNVEFWRHGLSTLYLNMLVVRFRPILEMNAATPTMPTVQLNTVTTRVCVSAFFIAAA